MRFRPLHAAFVPLVLLACSGDSTGGGGASQVRIRFSVPSAPRADVVTTAATAGMLDTPLVVTGSNGTLTITRIVMVVSKFALKGEHDCVRADSTHQEHGEHERDCRFRGKPFLLDLPLGGGDVSVATDAVPAGTYDELKFKVRDLHEDADDDDDAHEQAGLAEVRAALKQAFPDVPDAASMVVTGTFTPTGGTAKPFTTYFRAEVEVEMPIDPPLVVPAGGGSPTVTVHLDPTRWFERSSDRVLDLSAFDGRLLPFEADMHVGFERCDHDRD
ncbi:MAG TPA: hypothetical protein VFQ38_18445 [Longimicrobiales bacterium]|nr:hypothetical protein [Longimicrobiales bacterium]